MIGAVVLIFLGYCALAWTGADASNRPLDADVILRQHYGVAFTPKQTFTPTTGYWLHTFAFTLPSTPPIPKQTVFNCTQSPRNFSDAESADIAHCARVKPYVERISDIQKNMSLMLSDVLTDIERLVPARRVSRPRTRHTRSWLPFVGNVLKTVAGTATTDDVAKLQKALYDMRRASSTAYNQWTHSEANMASMIHVVNQRMTALYRLVDDQRLSMRTQYNHLSGALDDLFSMTSLIPILITRVSEFSNALVHMTELRTALLDAIHGHLSTFLVNSSHMASALHRINGELRSIHPLLKTVHTSLTDVYQSNDFIIHRVSRDIFITVKFHITPLQDTLTLYNIRSFPVALPDGSRHVTELDTVFTAFAYSPTVPYFI